VLPQARHRPRRPTAPTPYSTGSCRLSENFIFFMWISPGFILPDFSTYLWYDFMGWLPNLLTMNNCANIMKYYVGNVS